MWLTYSASDNQVARLDKDLSIESEQGAKNIPSTNQMMAELEKDAPGNSFRPLKEFKENSWRALNSYAHSGIHPIKRKEEGRWPLSFLEIIFKQSNGLAVIAGFHAVALRHEQPLQREILKLIQEFGDCFTPMP